ncbi:MAG: toxin-antitoxin system HicB family antitoxin [Synergistaceae bacterium]|nr:toxin-antitoxin system HicB family antitoxin [Synergistaceae bacterium]
MSNQYVIKQTYLRMPEELHKRLRHEAAEDDVSLNQCILNLLSEALEARHASVPSFEQTPPQEK